MLLRPRHATNRRGLNRPGVVAELMAVAALLMAGTACAAANRETVTVGRPCVAAAAPAVYSHVVVIFMENKSFGQIIGSSQAPYVNALARECALATQYRGVAYPSLPNYLAATSGSTFGVTDDASPAAHPLGSASIFSQTGGNWLSLSESMPANCDRTDAYPYAVKHNPAAYYTNVASVCGRQNIPLGAHPSFAARYTFVTPNVQHDMHDGTIAQGDGWLKAFASKVIESPGYQAGSTILLIVWDTDDRSSANRVPALVVAPQVRPGTTSAAAFNHYALLRLTENALGLPLLGNAKNASSMRAAFHL